MSATIKSASAGSIDSATAAPTRACPRSCRGHTRRCIYLRGIGGTAVSEGVDDWKSENVKITENMVTMTRTA